jgi:hypothetical protein
VAPPPAATAPPTTAPPPISSCSGVNPVPVSPTPEISIENLVLVCG